VFSLGVTLVATPVTSTALAAVDDRHAGIASGVNNAVARVANLLAVAVLPLIAGITGDRFYDGSAMTRGFHIAMLACAGVAAAGGVVAWLTISDDALAETQPDSAHSCPVAGPPWQSGAARSEPDGGGVQPVKGARGGTTTTRATAKRGA
jgi:hypothetical protein